MAKLKCSTAEILNIVNLALTESDRIGKSEKERKTEFLTQLSKMHNKTRMEVFRAVYAFYEKQSVTSGLVFALQAALLQMVDLPVPKRAIEGRAMYHAYADALRKLEEIGNLAKQTEFEMETMEPATISPDDENGFEHDPAIDYEDTTYGYSR
jgi:hypothetical protein